MEMADLTGYTQDFCVGDTKEVGGLQGVKRKNLFFPVSTADHPPVRSWDLFDNDRSEDLEDSLREAFSASPLRTRFSLF